MTTAPEVRIRSGAPADLAFVMDLGLRTVADSASALRPAEPGRIERSYGSLLHFALGRKHELFIAHHATERLGFLLLLTDMPDEVAEQDQAFVAYMAVEPHARRRGVGRALLAAAEAHARAAKLPALALMVTEDNMDARSLYAELGFTTERRLLCKPL